MPKELGGDGYSTFQQALIQEQTGRVTNALGWVLHTPASLAAERGHARTRWSGG